MSEAVIYEITAQVNSELIEKYEEYMCRRHIPDLLATGYFRAASFNRSADGRYRICYEAFNQEALDNYLKQQAPRLRADFNSHFLEGVVLSREIWTVVESFEKKDF